jgi:hypothetical protein
MRTLNHRMLRVRPHALDLAQTTRLAAPVAVAAEAPARPSDNFSQPGNLISFPDFYLFIKSHYCFVLASL